jgi:hypothetical protein
MQMKHEKWNQLVENCATLLPMQTAVAELAGRSRRQHAKPEGECHG